MVGNIELSGIFRPKNTRFERFVKYNPRFGALLACGDCSFDRFGVCERRWSVAAGK